MGQVVQMIGNTAGSPFVAKSKIAQAKASAEALAMEAGADASDLYMKGATALANAKLEALNYNQKAEDYKSMIGGFADQGRQERELRTIQLGQDKGNIVSAAAGSGIDVSSRIVDKTLKDTTRSAYNDLETSAINEQSKISNAQTNAKIARTNAENALAIGQWQSDAYGSLAQQVLDNGTLAAQNELNGGIESAKLGMYATWLGSSMGSSV